MAIPELKDTKERLTDCIYFGDPLSASVGSGFVVNARTISTTAPLQGGGDLSANRTLTIDEFTGSTPGSVPTSAGTGTDFLRDDGTWQTVYPLTDGDKGDVTVTAAGTAWAIDAGVVSTSKMGVDVTAAGKALLTAATAGDQQTALGLGTAAVLDVAAVGDAAVGEVVKGDDTRLTDTRTPSAHVHAESEVTGLVADLAQKITTDGTARTIVQKAGATVGTRRGINLIEGAGVTLTVTDTAASERVDVTIAASSGVADGDKGDVTVSSSGATWTIDDEAVGFSKLVRAVGDAKILGSSSSGAGNTYEELSLGTNISITGSTINVSSGTATLGDGDMGDIVISGTGTVATIDAGVVTLAKMANLSAPGKVIGRKTAGAGVPEELAIGTDLQAYDADLAAIAALTSAADRVPYFTGSGTAALATLTSFGRTLIDDADQATAQATLGVRVGTDVQPYDADLAALATTASAANKLPYYTGAGTAATTDLSPFMRTVLDDTTAAAACATLGAEFANALTFRPEQYSGVADGKRSYVGGMTSGSPTLTISGTGDSFAAGDVGKTIAVEGAGASSGLLVTTIAGYTSPTVVTLTANAGTTCVGAWVYWGTNNSTPFTNMAAALPAASKVVLSPGVYVSTTALSLAVQNCTVSGAGQGATTLIILSTTANAIEWTVTGTAQTVEDLSIHGMGGVMTAGAAIAYVGSATPYWGSGLRNIFIDRYYDGWVCTAKNGAQYEASHLMIHRPVRYGVFTTVAFMLHGGQIFQYQTPYTSRFSINSGTTTVAAGSATFTAHDIGDYIVIAGAVSGGTDLKGKITAVASATSCTIDTAATATVTNATGGIGSRMDVGWYQQHAGAYISNLDVIGGRAGMLIFPGTGDDAFYISGLNVLLDSQEDVALQVAQAGTGTARDIKFTGSWFASAGASWNIAGYNGIGAYLSTGTANTIEHVTFTGCEFVNNRGGGLLTQQVYGLTVNGGLFENSGTQQAYISYGRDTVLTNNRFTHETYGSDNTYCVNMLSTAATICVIGNLFRGFTSAATANVTHNGTSIIVANNATRA